MIILILNEQLLGRLFNEIDVIIFINQLNWIADIFI